MRPGVEVPRHLSGMLACLWGFEDPGQSDGEDFVVRRVDVEQWVEELLDETRVIATPIVLAEVAVVVASIDEGLLEHMGVVCPRPPWWW